MGPPLTKRTPPCELRGTWQRLSAQCQDEHTVVVQLEQRASKNDARVTLVDDFFGSYGLMGLGSSLDQGKMGTYGYHLVIGKSPFLIGM